jgi:restriction endonuclease S subunit
MSNSKEFSFGTLGSLFSGLYTSRQPLANLLYLQVSDFNADGSFKKVAEKSLHLDSSTERYLLKDGDVLFAAKGSNNYATTYKQEYGQAIASSSFIVVRLNQEATTLVRPEFLAWFLNTSAVQAILKRNAVGTSISSISIPQLSAMKITIPSLAKQELILKLHQLSLKKISLLEQILQLEKTFLQTLLINSTKK